MSLEGFSEALEKLVAQDPTSYGDSESIVTLQSALTRLEAFVSVATAAFERSGEWSETGAKTATAWLSRQAKVSKREARRQLRLKKAVEDLTKIEEAWRSGELSADHISAIASVRSASTEEALRRDESMLLDQGKELSFEDFQRALSYWHQLADPDGSEEDQEVRRSRRDVYLTQSFRGMWLGKMTLDPISGEIVSNELTRLENELFEADWSEASERLGHEPTSGNLARSQAQRRADALVEMATRSGSTLGEARRPAPLFSVYVDYETFSGRLLELAQGMAVTPGSLVPWIDRAYIERAVFRPDGRVEVSETARFYTGATRRAIKLRDRRCTHPYCDRPADECEIDHIVPFSQGGKTTQENGRVLCRYHNRLRNQRPPP